MINQLKVFFTTLLLCGLLLSVASITIFKPISFDENVLSYKREWSCPTIDNCTMSIYPNDGNPNSLGWKYTIPPYMLEKMIKEYMKTSKILYS